jgi:uncharacterized membrane protein YqjE
MPDSEPTGLFGSARNLIDTGLAAVQNRAELLSLEFKEEKDQILEMGLWLTLALFFGIMTVLVLTATVILLFPEEYRVYAAGAFCVVYLAGTIWAILGLRRRLQNRALPFAATVEELKKDREWLVR